MNSNFFDPHKSFLSLNIVKVTAFTLLTFSISIAIIIVCSSNLTFNWGYEGFNLFFTVFKFPLSIAALIIPVIALLAANHRSEQTKEQIRVTHEQNVFSNYYKHIDEFTKYLSERVDKDVDLRFAHHNIYQDASSGNYAINPLLLEMLSRLDQIVSDIDRLYTAGTDSNLDDDFQRSYYEIICELYNFMYRDSIHYVRYLTLEARALPSSSYVHKSISLINVCNRLVEKIEVLCKFSIDYVSPIKHLSSEHLKLKLDNIYVQNTPDAQKGLDMGPNSREDQTLEQATNKFMQLIHKTLE